jgi:FKBP-type peptidyl-prolyl cis-trans isomerase (trigger factor)
MTKVRVRIEVEREQPPEHAQNRNYNFDEVYVQTINMNMPETLVNASARVVNDFLVRELQAKEAKTPEYIARRTELEARPVMPPAKEY